MWDLIASVPDHCLSFYFSTIVQSFSHIKTVSGSHRELSAGKK